MYRGITWHFSSLQECQQNFGSITVVFLIITSIFEELSITLTSNELLNDYLRQFEHFCHKQI